MPDSSGNSFHTLQTGKECYLFVVLGVYIQHHFVQAGVILRR